MALWPAGGHQDRGGGSAEFCELDSKRRDDALVRHQSAPGRHPDCGAAERRGDSPDHQQSESGASGLVHAFPDQQRWCAVDCTMDTSILRAGKVATLNDQGSGASADNSLRSAAEALKGTLVSDGKRLEIRLFCFAACGSSIRQEVFAGPKSLDALEPLLRSGAYATRAAPRPCGGHSPP